MIVPMSKVHIVTREHDRDNLLDSLGALGVVHVEPIDPAMAVADEETIEAMGVLDSAIRILQGVTAAGQTPEREPMQAAREVVALFKAVHEEKEQLSTLHRQADQLAMWGNVELKTLGQLKEAGVEVKFYIVPDKDVAQCQADCLQVLSEMPGHQALIAVVDRRGQFELPEGSKVLDWPARDLPSIKQEAANLDASIKSNQERLASLANLLDKVQAERETYLASSEYTIAQKSGMSKSSLYALKGWVPQAKAGGLNDALTQKGIPAAVDVIEPEEGEEPPTLIEYPKWTIPIKALFDMLGTLPGYEEFDLSTFFMVGLPLFAAMLIGDAGYGLIILVLGLAFYKKMVAASGKPAPLLLIVFGLATMVYGILTANYFGVTPQTLIDAGNEAGAKTMMGLAPLYRLDAEAGRTLIMKLSIAIGCLHLIVAHLRRVVALWPNVRAFAEIGWMVILADMFAIIWFLMFPESGSMPAFLGPVLLVAVLVVSWCSEPQANPIKRFMTGFAGSILPLLGTFSDIMSYIRLFAVGLASYYIADAFNGLGAQVASASSWLLGAPIVIFGHVLNIALAAIAIFAHGVRLNMLEFSNNVGVKWAGYAYRPFTKNIGTSIGENEL